MAADLGQSVAVEHHDQVGHPDRAEPVRHEHGDAGRVATGVGRVGVPLRELGARSRRPGRQSARPRSSATARRACSRGTAQPSATGRSSAPDRLARSDRASLFRPSGQSLEHIRRPCPHDRAAGRRRIIEPRQLAHSDAALGGELEPEEVLERPGDPFPPAGRRHRASGRSSIRIRPPVGSWSLASSLTSVDFPAPFSLTIATADLAGRVRSMPSKALRLAPG